MSKIASTETEPMLKARLDQVLGGIADSGATYVARVIEVSTGREMYAHDPDRPVAPASNCKLSNVAAGLDRFGPDFVWRTYLALDGDDLWIIGTGDPACGDLRIEKSRGRDQMAMLDDWADALLSRGITHITGKLIFDDGVFDDERVSDTWLKHELTEWWAAPISGLTFNGSCINVTAYPDRLEVIPKTQDVKLINEARTTGPAEPMSITRDANSNTFTIKGLITKKEELDIKGIVDPGFFFADVVRTRLKERGITIEGATERSSRSDADEKWHALKALNERDARIVATYETLLRDIAWRINKQSQNLFADALCKLQGRAWDQQHGREMPGSWKAGSEAIHDFLRRMDIDDSKYVLIDGSGLSADNRVTARLISDLLLKMMKHKYADTFQESMSICGKDGTLEDRLSDIAGMVQGKTGTIDGVKALSAYLTTRRRGTLVISMIFNDAPKELESKCADLMDEACRIMVNWPDVAASQ